MIENYKVWTSNGWANIRRLIRHKSNKKLYRITTHTGMVDVTEDHSLLDNNHQILKPKEAKIGIHLLHHYPIFEKKDISLQNLLSYIATFGHQPIEEKKAFIYGSTTCEVPKEILNELNKSGADLSRVIMGHLDRTIDSIGGLSEIASFGCVLEWDLFGVEVSYYQPADFDMPNDIQRLDYIREMMNMGLSDRIVLAQDICTKHRLAKYGGHGYGYILEHIVPRMRMKGFSEEEINAVIVDTPTRMLTIV